MFVAVFKAYCSYLVLILLELALVRVVCFVSYRTYNAATYMFVSCVLSSHNRNYMYVLCVFCWFQCNVNQRINK
jgi:hypothetical protein